MTPRIRTIGIALAAYVPKPDLFAAQLRSIADQSFRDWTCVITFDSELQSVLGHPALRGLASDVRFRFFQNPSRLGHRMNFQEALARALELSPSPDAIAFSDQDDIWEPHKLGLLAKRLGESGPLTLVHSDLSAIGPGGERLARSVWRLERRAVSHITPDSLLLRNIVTGCTVLMDAELARRYPKIPDSFEFHDHWFAIAAAAHGGVRSVSEPLVRYRQTGENVVGARPPGGTMRRPKSRIGVEFLQKSREAWLETAHRLEDALAAGIPLAAVDEAWLGRRSRAILNLTSLGLGSVARDPELARQAFKRAIGRALA